MGCRWLRVRQLIRGRKAASVPSLSGGVVMHAMKFRLCGRYTAPPEREVSLPRNDAGKS